eukprot:4128483-Pleurochrysis_carterae.AAC.5
MQIPSRGVFRSGTYGTSWSDSLLTAIFAGGQYDLEVVGSISNVRLRHYASLTVAGSASIVAEACAPFFVGWSIDMALLQAATTGHICEVRLPAMNATDFFFHRPEIDGPVSIFDRRTKKLIFRVNVKPLETGTARDAEKVPFEPHQVASAAFHLRALKCIRAGNDCHPCMAERCEHERVQRMLGHMDLAAVHSFCIAFSIPALRVDGQHVNKVQLAIKVGGKCGTCHEAMNKRLWSTHDTFCLRSCYDPHDVSNSQLAFKRLAARDIK